MVSEMRMSSQMTESFLMGEIFFLSAHQIHTRYRNNTMMGASTRVRLFEETLIPHTHTLSKITKDAHRHIQIVMIQLIIALQYYPKKKQRARCN